MLITIKDKTQTMTLSTLGAEPVSFLRDGIEYIWQADKAFWPRHAPLLFPISGPMKDGNIYKDGKAYPMPGNGFARDTEFNFVSQTETSATFCLSTNADTLTHYPYDFSLTVTYTLLEEGGYEAKAEIVANEALPCVFAWHPAFSLDINGKGADLETYTVAFEENECLDRHLPVNGVFKTEKNFVCGDELQLSRKETDKGPIALDNLKSSEVTLVSSLGEHGVTVTMGEMTTLVVWTIENKGAQYICIEPMYSFGDASRNFNMDEMKEAMHLKKGEKKTFTNEFKFF